MFGWEFPPITMGGLGVACEGLVRGLVNHNVKVTFVLPRKLPVNVPYVKFVSASLNEIDKTYVNSLLTPYMTSEEYTQTINELEKNGNFEMYGKSLFQEVERYAISAATISSKEEFDIIHAHDWLTYKAGVNAKKASGKKLVVHVHATEFDRTGGNGINSYVYEIEKYGMENADAVICVSNFTKRKVIENYGIPESKIRVVHNAIDNTDRRTEEKNPFKQGKKVVLFLGRITLQKGPDYFLYVAKRVLDYYPNVVFIMAGSGDMERFSIETAVRLGLADKVFFTGFLRGEDINRAYKMADLYVMPSVSEPFGLTPLESIMNGTPALISKQSGVSEVLNHCLKADFWDIDDMANKIIGVLKYKELHHCLKENSFNEVKKINWNDSAAKCLKIYNEVLTM